MSLCWGFHNYRSDRCLYFHIHAYNAKYWGHAYSEFIPHRENAAPEYVEALSTFWVIALNFSNCHGFTEFYFFFFFEGCFYLHSGVWALFYCPIAGGKFYFTIKAWVVYSWYRCFMLVCYMSFISIESVYYVEACKYFTISFLYEPSKKVQFMAKVTSFRDAKLNF